jgi:hypothetical protein
MMNNEVGEVLGLTTVRLLSKMRIMMSRRPMWLVMT